MSKELFIERSKEYFSDEHDRFISELDRPHTQGFFLNTRKNNRENILNIIDFDYSDSKYTDQSFTHSYDNIGKTIAYDLGLIYPQEIASSLTSRYVDTEDVHLIVDMCAAPGGKSINILNRTSKDVLCISNDINHTRAKILAQNLERLGLDNVIVTNKKCDVLAKELKGSADIVILDAPCSGEGIVRKYPEIFDDYSVERINELAAVQKQLLEEAYEMLNGSGRLIYSTCTYSLQEDEKQIEDFLNRHPDMSIENVDIDSFSKLIGTVKLSILNGTEGQFFAIMRKTGVRKETHLKTLKQITDPTAERFVKENLDLDNYYLYRYNDHFYISLMPLIDMKNNIIRYGIYLGDIVNGRFEPNHDLYRANSLKGKYRYVYELNDDEYIRYIQGYELKAQLDDHYYLLTYKNNSLGFGKCAKGIIKNKYPKGLRRVV